MAEVTGTKKAAILLLALKSEEAGQVLRHLRRDEVDALTLEVANLRKLERGLRDEVVGEFVKMVETETVLAEGGIDYARTMLETAFDPGRASEIAAADAIVVAFAGTWPDPIVLTSDPGDITSLSEHAATPITVAAAH